MSSRKEGVSEGHCWSWKEIADKKKKKCVPSIKEKCVRRTGMVMSRILIPLLEETDSQIHRFYSREVARTPEPFQ